MSTTTITQAEADLLDKARGVLDEVNALRSRRGETVMFCVSTRKGALLCEADGRIMIGHPAMASMAIEGNDLG